MYLSHCIRKPTMYRQNKDAYQMCNNCAADQRLCFRYTDSTVPLLLKSKISRFYPASVTIQGGLCQIWLETQRVGFLMRRLIFNIFAQNIDCGYFCEAVLMSTHNLCFGLDIRNIGIPLQTQVLIYKNGV